MKTILILRQAPSGRFLMILYMVEMQKRVLGLMSGQLVYPKQTRQQYPVSIWLEKGQPSLLTRVQSPPTSDSFYFSSSRPLISYSKQSVCYLLLTSALQTMQMSPLSSTANPNIPTLLTPSQLLVYSSDCGSELIFFCSCIIQAYYLFLGMPPPVEKEQSARCFRGRVLAQREVLQSDLIFEDWVSSLWRERVLSIVYNVN